MRKLIMMLLSAAICTYAVGAIPALAKSQYSLKEYEEVTGKKIIKFNEAPMLKRRVAAGELPPVEQRLPEEPVVVPPIEKIGQYGGQLTLHSNWPDLESSDLRQMIGFENFVIYDTDLETILPNIVDKWEFSEDLKALTLHLRKGIKWSDGVPYTADDIMFWWEDVILNKELTPVVPAEYCPGGEPMSIKKVNDYTVRLNFAAPYPFMIPLLAREWGGMGSMPKHYLTQFHIKYNPKAKELAKENGFDFWYQYFWDRGYCYCGLPKRVDLPTLHAFRLVKRASDYEVWERNPYYFKVDSEGNQLPYIDRILLKRVTNEEMMRVKMISGEADYGWNEMGIENYTLLKENEEKGNYTVHPFPISVVGPTFRLNLTTADPIKREMLNDIRFRRALSLAINRQEINDIAYFGLGTPSQMTVEPTSPFYEPEFAAAYAEYDPEEANRLLDEMGLEWDEKGEYRLGPDGKKMEWTVDWNHSYFRKPIELVQRYWREVGLNVTFKERTWEVCLQRVADNKVEIMTWAGNTGLVWDYPHPFVPVANAPWFNGSPEWAEWLNTDGEKGTEPPKEIKENYQAWRDMMTTADKEERIRLAKKILKSNAENLWVIGTVQQLPLVLFITRNNLRNYPKEVPLADEKVFYIAPWHPEQFFLEPPLFKTQKY